jgi:hypothetical protein
MRPWRARSPPQWLRLLLLLLPVELLTLLQPRKRLLRSPRKRRAASKVLAPYSAESMIRTNDAKSLWARASRVV